MAVAAFARDGGDVETIAAEPDHYRLRARGGFAMLRIHSDTIEVVRLYADRPLPRVRPLLDEPRLPPPSPMPPRDA